MYQLARSLLFQLDPEVAHHVTMDQLAKWPALARLVVPNWRVPSSLSQNILGLSFAHPVGLAAGLDKDAVAVNGLFQCGFSHVEVGTVTPVAQPGNPKPRLYRLKADEALVNRMGFNNHGAHACATRVAAISKRMGPIGINIGKNKVTDNQHADDDYDAALNIVIAAADYITVNISSPNTPGLRDLQSAETILQLLNRLAPTLNRNNRPVLIKLSPDLTDDSLLQIAVALKERSPVKQFGIIATNTTLSREGLISDAKQETGGLSGRPLRARSTEVIKLVYQATEGRVPIVGCGGIFDAQDAYEKILAGASLVQIYTSFIYRGPRVVQEIALGVAKRLQADGFASIQDAIGQGV